MVWREPEENEDLEEGNVVIEEVAEGVEAPVCWLFRWLNEMMGGPEERKTTQ